MAAGFSRLSIRNNMGIRSFAVEMFIIHIFVDTTSVIHGIAIARSMCANILQQLFGVGALAHRGLSPFIGGSCGDHSPHSTTMTQTKCCPIFKFGSWWLHLPVCTPSLGRLFFLLFTVLRTAVISDLVYTLPRATDMRQLHVRCLGHLRSTR